MECGTLFFYPGFSVNALTGVEILWPLVRQGFRESVLVLLTSVTSSRDITLWDRRVSTWEKGLFVICKQNSAGWPGPSLSAERLLCHMRTAKAQLSVLIRTVPFGHSLFVDTDNPFYPDTRYNDKVRYDDNLTVPKPSIKKWQLMRNHARILHLNFKLHMFWIFVRIASVRRF